MRFALSKDLEIHKWVTEVVSGKKAKKERKLRRDFYAASNRETSLLLPNCRD